MTFLGNNYDRPKLTESKIIKKIIDTQVIEIPKEQKIFNYIMEFLFNNYQTIIFCIIIVLALYWRYEETKKKKQIEKSYYDEINSNDDFLNY
jgi:hypothetical protein